MSGVTRGERLAWAYLSAVAEPPDPGIARLVAEVGPVDAAERIRRGAVPGELLRRTEARRGVVDPSADLDAIEALGGRLVCPDDGEWPGSAFAALRWNGADEREARAMLRGRFPPIALWLRGTPSLEEVVTDSAAIVGTRAATPYGVRVSGEISAGLASARIAVVSGAAYGVDAAAHRGALAAGGPTVAVIACGPDRTYPAGNAGLLTEIAARGLVVSEYAPGVTPARHRFLTRNRLVAALTRGTVVVEAGWRSGALNTAHWARLLGRPVGAVPGPVSSVESRGCHRLLREHPETTTLVSDADEVIELVGPMGALAPLPVVPPRRLDGLPEEVRRAYDAFPAVAACTPGFLAESSGIPLSAVRSAVARLELLGLVTRDSGGWRRV